MDFFEQHFKSTVTLRKFRAEQVAETDHPECFWRAGLSNQYITYSFRGEFIQNGDSDLNTFPKPYAWGETPDAAIANLKTALTGWLRQDAETKAEIARDAA